ncbi:Por secretion system C-terminal sorting domain-containing protein [Flavobacterium daejeonense]|nr:Por secretion system C-terminal sorting domain-containing protein [Flavobacterium daejeonense]
MKKIVKISLVLGIVLLAMNVYAVAVNFSLHNKFRQEKMISFGLEDSDVTKISIYDANDKLIHTENVLVDGKLVRSYDLNNFREGVYYLVEESKTKISKYEVLVLDDSATIMSDPSAIVNKTAL